MKKYFLFLSVLVLIAFNFSQSVHAAALQASDVVGQTDGNGDPTFTTGNQSNLTSVNSQGLGGGDAFLDTALDSVNHRLFVSDAVNNRVLVFSLDSDNELLDHTADYVLGQTNFTSNSSGVTQSKMNGPHALVYNTASSTLFISDKINNRVLVYDFSTTTISNGMNATYVLGQTTFTSGSTGITRSTMNTPTGLSLDPANRLFVADQSNNRVLVYDFSTTTISTGMNALYVLGEADFTSNANTTAQNRLRVPVALAYDSVSSRLFVGETTSRRVVIFNVATSTIANGINASNVLGQTNFTNTTLGAIGANNFDQVSDLSYDSSRSLLFASDESDARRRILVFDVATSTISNNENASYVLGQLDFVSNVAPSIIPTASTTNNPRGLVYSGGKLYLGDYQNRRVLIFDVSSSITNGMSAYDLIGQTDGQDNPAFSSNTQNNRGYKVNSFSYPTGITIDLVHHRLFVRESPANGRVLVYNLDSDNLLEDDVADYVLGKPDFTSSNNLTTSAATLGGDYGIDYDSAHNRLFVGDENRVLVYDFSSGITTGMNASYVLGQSNFTTTTSGLTQSGLDDPNGVLFDDETERLFVSDSGNNRILVFDFSTTTISNGMNASYVLGQDDFTSSDDDVSQDRFSYCLEGGLAYDSERKYLFVPDPCSSRVLVFDLSGGITTGMNASYVLGQSDFTTDSYATDANGIGYQPGGMAYDEANKMLYVTTDDDSSRILVFDTSTITAGEDAVAIIGSETYTADETGSPTRSTVGYSEGMTFDSQNRLLYVADSGNYRVLIFPLINLASDALPNATDGIGYNAPLSSSQSQGTVTYTLTEGSLPPGLSLNNGQINGTPTTAGTYTFTLSAHDALSADNVFTDSKEFSITVAGGHSSHSGGGSGGTSRRDTQAPVSTTSPVPKVECSQGYPCGSLPPQAAIPAITNAVTSPSSRFTKDLELGSIGPDVLALQLYLNSHGFTVSLSGPGSPGQETNLFGEKTLAALSKLQASLGITPAAGYFGPKTRAALGASLEPASSVPSPSLHSSIFTRDLKIGDIGEDVRALQKYLNNHGFIVATSGNGSPGHEVLTFGPGTKAALSKFQASLGITPAAGYFGQKTKAAVTGGN